MDICDECEADPCLCAVHCEIDETTKSEYDAVCDMLNEAGEHGLTVEVVKAFGEYMAAGGEVVASCAAALCEWDI